MVKLENWSVTYSLEDCYVAPELRGGALLGTCYGHPKHKDGSVVKTSQIKKAMGKIVQTRNTIYELGSPDPDYLEWLENHDYNYDPDMPVKVR